MVNNIESRCRYEHQRAFLAVAVARARARNRSEQMKKGVGNLSLLFACPPVHCYVDSTSA